MRRHFSSNSESIQIVKFEVSQPVLVSFLFRTCRESQSNNHCKGPGHERDNTSGVSLHAHKCQFRFMVISLEQEEVAQLRRTPDFVNSILP